MAHSKNGGREGEEGGGLYDISRNLLLLLLEVDEVIYPIHRPL